MNARALHFKGERTCIGRWEEVRRVAPCPKPRHETRRVGGVGGAYVEHDPRVVDEHIQPVVGSAVRGGKGAHGGEGAHVEGHELQLMGVCVEVQAGGNRCVLTLVLKRGGGRGWCYMMHK